MLKIAQLTLSLLAATTLAACGGGSSSSASTTTPPAVGAEAPYIASWKTACEGDDAQANNASGAYLNSNQTLVGSSSSANTLLFTVTRKIYAATDTACSGSVLSTMVYPVNITFDGTAVIAGQTVDKGTSTSGAFTSLVSGGVTMAGASLGSSATTINGIFYPSGYFVAHPSEKELLRATATQLFSDDGSGTATTYPTGMDPVAIATKI